MKAVIAIDPGREKCGFAVVSLSGDVVYKAIVDVRELPEVVTRWASEAGLDVVACAIGDRTGARDVVAALRAAGVRPELIRSVDEHRSSEAGRRRYWREKPPRGWRRLIPVSMQTPPEPYDDFVAVELAHRYLADVSGR